MLRALRQNTRGQLYDKQVKDMLKDYASGRKTRKQATGVRSSGYGQNVDWNTYRKVIGASQDSMSKDRNLKRANKCMQRKVMRGASAQDAFSACGMSLGSSTNKGSKRSHDIVYDEDTY